MSSREIRKTSAGNLSSARQASCSIKQLEEAGIDRRKVYVTNAVKHFTPVVMATVHPSSILRAPDEETRHQEMRRFIEDLRKIAQVL